MKVLFFLAAIIAMAHSKQYCQTVDDCMHLGANIDCIYSMCDDWGLCGCQRTKHMYFLGSERKFACVPIKKVGETCSTRDDTGFCGATNAYCKHGWCECEVDERDPPTFNYEVRWGGEACLDVQGEFQAGESCYKSTDCEGSLDCLHCYNAGGAVDILDWGRYSTDAGNAHFGNLPQTPIDHNVRVCGCLEGQRLVVPNEFSSASFMGRNKPECKPIRVGDKCVRDADCGSIWMMEVDSDVTPSVNRGWKKSVTKDDTTTFAAKCVDNVCKCMGSGHVADITGMYCAPPLAGGANCAYDGSVHDTVDPADLRADIVGVCNGEVGLMCGDPCRVDKLQTTRDYTCQCAPGWEGRGGTSCTRATEGTSCTGDYQCTSLAPNAWCQEGACTNGSPAVAVSVLTLCLPLLAVILQRN